MGEPDTRHRPLVSGIRIRAVAISSQGDSRNLEGGTLTGLATCRSTLGEIGCAPSLGAASESTRPEPVASSPLADQRAKRIPGLGVYSGENEPYLSQGLISSLPNWRLSSIIWCASLAPSRG